MAGYFDGALQFCTCGFGNCCEAEALSLQNEWAKVVHQTACVRLHPVTCVHHSGIYAYPYRGIGCKYDGTACYQRSMDLVTRVQ